MILVDTNVWADHINGRDARLALLVETDQVCIHPHIIGEVAMGNLRNFNLTIRFLQSLRQVDMAQDHEVITMVREHSLSGTGIGYTDAHLVASMLITPNTLLWTRDRRLYKVAERFGLAIKP